MEIYLNEHKKRRQSILKKCYSKLRLINPKQQQNKSKQNNKKISNRINNLLINNSVLKIINKPAFLLERQLKKQNSYTNYCNNIITEKQSKGSPTNNSQKQYNKKKQSNNALQYKKHCRNATIQYLRKISTQKISSEQKIKFNSKDYFHPKQTYTKYSPSRQPFCNQVYYKIAGKTDSKLQNYYFQSQSPTFQEKAGIYFNNDFSYQKRRKMQLKSKGSFRVSSALQLKVKDKPILWHQQQKLKQNKLTQLHGWQIETIEDSFIS